MDVPYNVKGLVWKVKHNRISTKDNLQKHNIIQPKSETNCVQCNSELQIAKHLFFNCKFANEVWDRCYWWGGKMRTQPKGTQGHFLQHEGNLRGKKAKLAWWTVWMNIVWAIWKNRNIIIFKEANRDMEAVVEEMQYFFVVLV